MRNKKITVGKAALRGAVRNTNIPTQKRRRIVSIKHRYSFTDDKHDYNQSQMKSARKVVQGQRMMADDAPGGTNVQRRIIKEEGKTDRIRGQVRKGAYRKVRKSTSVRINGREIIRRAEEGRKDLSGIGKISMRQSYADIGRSAGTIGPAAENDRAAADASGYFNTIGDKAKNAAGHVSLKPGRARRRQAQIEKLETKLEKTGKKMYRTDRKLGRSIKRTKRSYARMTGNNGATGSLRGGLGGGLKGSLRGGANAISFLRGDVRTLRLAQRKTGLMQQRQQTMQRLNILKKKKSSNPLEGLVKRFMIVAFGSLAFMALPIVILFVALGNAAGGGSASASLSFQEDAAVVASYLYDHQSELWTRNRADMVRITAVLGVLGAQTSDGYDPIRISHRYYTDSIDTSLYRGKKNASGSGWQGFCAWTNEELAAFIASEREAGRYAGYEDDQKTADLYTQCHYLKEKLLELKTNPHWTSSGISPEEASVIAYRHLILQSDGNTQILTAKDEITHDRQNAWSYIYSAVYSAHLEEYDICAEELAELDTATADGRINTCYPTYGSRNYAFRREYIVPVTVPHLMSITKGNGTGEKTVQDMEAYMVLNCHWMIASRLYESFYEAKAAGYRLSETCTCFVDNPEHPDSAYALGLAIAVNQAENTPDANGICHESKWGSVIDEALANIFKDHGFSHSSEEDPMGPVWEFSWI